MNTVTDYLEVPICYRLHWYKIHGVGYYRSHFLSVLRNR